MAIKTDQISEIGPVNAESARILDEMEHLMQEMQDTMNIIQQLLGERDVLEASRPANDAHNESKTSIL